jgi:hypothetical protein
MWMPAWHRLLPCQLRGLRAQLSSTANPAPTSNPHLKYATRSLVEIKLFEVFFADALII